MSETRCNRCGTPAQGVKSRTPEARLLKRATAGVCVDCGVVLFLQRLSNNYGGGLFQGHGPESLLLPHVQEQFAAVMRAGMSEAFPDEINWNRVVELWDIAPVPMDSLF